MLTSATVPCPDPCAWYIIAENTISQQYICTGYEHASIITLLPFCAALYQCPSLRHLICFTTRPTYSIGFGPAAACFGVQSCHLLKGEDPAQPLNETSRAALFIQALCGHLHECGYSMCPVPPWAVHMRAPDFPWRLLLSQSFPPLNLQISLGTHSAPCPVQFTNWFYPIIFVINSNQYCLPRRVRA